MAIRIGQSQDQCAKVALTHLFRMRKVPQSGQLAGHMPACWQLKRPARPHASLLATITCQLASRQEQDI